MERKLNKAATLEWGLVAVIVLMGAFLRLYRLPVTMVFQGDQGRDALVVKQLIKDGNLTFLGPVTSVGNMYLGPFYYYFMAPFLAMSYPSPLGPAYGVAIVNIGLLIVIYLMTKEMFGKMAGILSLFIYTLMVPAVALSRYSWNPNLAPMVSALIMWGLYRVYAKGEVRKLSFIGLGLGILAQLHYLAMIMLFAVLAIIGLTYVKKAVNRKKLIRATLAGVGIFALTFVPLMLFNFRHENMIIKSFINFVFSPEQHLIPGGSILRTLKETEGKTVRLLGQMSLNAQAQTNPLAAWLAIFVIGVTAGITKGKLFRDRGLQIILITMGLTIVGISVYSGSIFDHYLGFALPALAIFWGYFLTMLWRLFKVVGPVGVILLLGTYTYVNVDNSPTFAKASPPIERYRQTANDIAAQIGTGKYNVALLSESKDYMGMNYRYFLATSRNPPASIDDYEDLDFLAVIDELGVRDPLEVKITEIQTPSLVKLTNEFSPYPQTKVYIYGKGN